MTDCHIALYKKYNSLNGLHTKEMDKYKIIIEEHHIAAHTPKKDKKIKLAFDILKVHCATFVTIALFSQFKSLCFGKTFASMKYECK